MVKNSPAQMVRYLLNIVVTFVEFVLGLRIILKFLNANAQAPFVRWIYDTSDPLLAPFEGMFPTTAVDGTFVIEASALFALFTYAFIGYLVAELIRFVEVSAETASKKKK